MKGHDNYYEARFGYYRVGMELTCRKNKNSEKPVAESEPIPFGFRREALTNKDIAECAAFGFMSEENISILQIVMDRKDIYRIFP
uniref:Uncharacterized protein n=1 Tax=Candidatus Kentrum sp. TC TaxID=2126339 RepID=A0A450YX60_9GAMM|nr:MAG: hypothetical protein BECKTC1821D_GA0114238_10289 [Candidatus Kentron sp. TC]VFK46694.1 MAG: hypothetical protein BECKTC1821E_GA0114239_10686 [Candidatus Kentron sp. TC]VFK60383.1 MAG: hypothetical protein BECKTC1821F_GA0114240_104517 [Candidatus Kentron sp. TC]